MKMTTRRRQRDHSAPTMGKAVHAMAKKGRYGDNTVGHLTEGEVVVPKGVWQADPGLRQRTADAMARVGLDPAQYVVGHPRNSRNPRTGAREFAAQMVSDPVNGTYWYDPSTGSTSFTNPGQQQEAPNDPNASGGSNRTPNAMSAGQRNWGSEPNQQVNQQLAQATGFSGDFGSGGFSSYMATATPEQQAAAAGVLNSAGQGNRIDWNTGVTNPNDNINDPNASGGPKTPGTIYGGSSRFSPDMLARVNAGIARSNAFGAANPPSGFADPYDTPEAGNRNWGASQNVQANQGLADLTGYTGDFGGGAFNNWLYAQPNRNELESQVGQYLFDQGQADRANLYAWDRNGNGVVEGTEAAGVVQNADGSFTWPSGYTKGPLKDPFTTPGATVPIINPNIEGAPQAYAWGTGPGGMMPAGAWPDTMRDPIFGTTTYNAAPPPNANGQWLNPQFLPWDVRNGGTGDPYVPWTEEWAVKQAMAGNGYAAQALINAGYDPYDLAPDGNIGALTSGQGNPNAPGWDRGWQWQGPYLVNSEGVVQDGNGVLMIPQGNGLFLDTMYGFYRNGQGIIVNADGSPVITQYNQHIGGSSDPWRVFGSSNALAMMGQFAGVNLNSLNDGNNTPIVGNYGGGTPTPIAQTFRGQDIVTDIRGDPWATSVYNRATGSTGGPAGGAGGYAPGGVSTTPVNTGTNTNTGTNGTTTTGTGLTPGTLNSYSMPLGYGGINLFLGNAPTGQTGTSTQQQTSVDPLSWLSLLNLGYGQSTYGQPTYQSADPGQGGINYLAPNSQTVEFRTPFAYY